VQGESGKTELIVESLGEERLVYDVETNEAHRLGGAAALEFDAAGDDISRRQVLRKLALAGMAASAVPLIKTIAAPTAAHAQSGNCPGAPGGACLAGFICCNGNTCVPSSFSCCGSGSCPASFTCCPGTPATCCPPTFACGSAGCTPAT
jgi:hypothetical protein